MKEYRASRVVEMDLVEMMRCTKLLNYKEERLKQATTTLLREFAAKLGEAIVMQHTTEDNCYRVLLTLVVGTPAEYAAALKAAREEGRKEGWCNGYQHAKTTVLQALT